jgi:LytS/YehU family sensor histidine kinase
MFNLALWTSLWTGNSLLSHYLSRKIPWIDYPVKRFLAGIVVNIGYTILAVILLISVFELVSPISLGKGTRYTVYVAVVITILISIFLHAREFLQFWRKAAFEREKFEKESIAALYESLKSQVSPHFLFNSLNALTKLVYDDPDKAVKFIKQLSEVYRYVLDTRDKDVVPLTDELKFLDAYLFLQRIRFCDKLIVEIGRISGQTQVPPLALQMLIENAIKHNVISEEDPLTIRIFSDNGFLVVENNLQEKTHIAEDDSHQVGLENIRRRYEFISNEKVRIEKLEKTFVVRLPLLNERRE